MGTITIYGASDDLIEIEGDIREEFNVYENGHLTLSDGTVLAHSYTSVWRFQVERAGSATIQIERCPEDSEDTYTDKVTVSSPIEWVRQGIHEVPGSGDIPETFTDNVVVDENTSDGYHTFKELYEYRLLYNAALFNEWAGSVFYDVHKSRRHSDGELAFGEGWFVVVADLPTGQISNHYRDKDWDLFKVPERDRAAEWDGHTPADVAQRLRDFLTSR